MTPRDFLSLDVCRSEPTWRAAGAGWSELPPHWPPVIHCALAGARGPESRTTEGTRRAYRLVHRGAGADQGFPPRPAGHNGSYLAISLARLRTRSSYVHIENENRHGAYALFILCCAFICPMPRYVFPALAASKPTALMRSTFLQPPVAPPPSRFPPPNPAG